MNEFLIGTKNYDMDWYLHYELSYEDAVKLLRDSGISFVMSQSRYLQMADSAVNSETTPAMEARLASYDDLKFREALAKEGIDYWITVCSFFNPQAIANDPTLRPMGSNGKPMEMIDWYIGIPPSRKDYVAQQIEDIATATTALQPEGVFLSFTRWPGFWELWMPHHTRKDFPEYSYDSYTLERFSKETGIDIPFTDPIQAAAWIDENVRSNWTSWKCELVTDFVRQCRAAVRSIKSDVQIMINTLPFGAHDYDNARDKTYGQNLESLADVVDIFEVMTYHQILKRPISWIPQIGQEVKQRTGKKTVCTIQAEPLYLHGIHESENRAPTLSADEFENAVSAVEGASLDGVVVFIWSDLLRFALKQNDLQRRDVLLSSIAKRN